MTATTPEIAQQSITTPIEHFEHRGSGHKVTFVGMIHIAEPVYYDEIFWRACEHEDNGFAIHYEQIQPPRAKELSRATAVKMLLFSKACIDIYSVFDGMGLAKQSEYFHHPDSWHNIDAPVDEMLDQLSITTLARAASLTRAGMMARAARKSIQGDEFILDSFRKIVMEAARPVDPLTQTITQLLMGNFDNVIVDYRNQIALRGVDEHRIMEEGSGVMMLWGAGHLPGIAQGLRLRGYDRVSSTDAVAISW